MPGSSQNNSTRGRTDEREQVLELLHVDVARRIQVRRLKRALEPLHIHARPQVRQRLVHLVQVDLP